MEPLFEEVNSRSIFVPNEANIIVSDKMKNLINTIVTSDGGNTDAFD